jgi:transposase-like protein
MGRPKKYRDELVQRGVRLALEGDRPIAHIAHDLGMHAETLRKKVRQAEADSGRRADLLTMQDTSAGDAQRPAGPQACGQLAPQRAATLHIEGLVDRLMGDTHRLIIGEVQAQPVGDLLGAPRTRPAPVLPPAVAAADPLHLRAVDGDPVRALHRPRQAVLHVAAQLGIHGELRGLGAPRPLVGVPLGGRGPVLEPAAASRSVTTELSGDRRRRAAELTRDLPDAGAAGAQKSDLLPLGKRQVPPRERAEGDRRHPATLPKPADADRRRHPGLHRSILARQSARDRRPEPHTMLPPTSRRPPRRAHPRPPCPIRCPSLRAHRNSSRPTLRRPIDFAQYTSIDYTQTLPDHGLLDSVGTVGDAYDNALAESFVDSFKTELIADRVWRTRAQLELAVVEYIGWFNDCRLHQALGDLPPSEFERPSQSSSLEISLS